MNKPEHTLKKLISGDQCLIASLGDSLTEGWMVEKGYLDFLEDMIADAYPKSKVKFINRGISGDTAEDGLFRLSREIETVHPDLVLVQFGLNDAFCGISPNEFGRTIETIIDRIQNVVRTEAALVTSVPILNNPYEDGIMDSFYDKLGEIAVSRNLPVANVHRMWRKRTSEGLKPSILIQSDWVHPTVEGYRLMAEAIMQDIFLKPIID
jgi:lysophospholipase L1-like esterase